MNLKYNKIFLFLMYSVPVTALAQQLNSEDISPVNVLKNINNFTFKIESTEETKIENKTLNLPLRFYAKNEGGYDAWFNVTWMNKEGDEISQRSPTKNIGGSWEFLLPQDAKNIRLSAYLNTADIFNPQRQIYDFPLDTATTNFNIKNGAFSYGIKVWDDLFTPKWGVINAPNSVSFDEGMLSIDPKDCAYQKPEPSEKTIHLINNCVFPVTITVRNEANNYADYFSGTVVPDYTTIISTPDILKNISYNVTQANPKFLAETQYGIIWNFDSEISDLQAVSSEGGEMQNALNGKLQEGWVASTTSLRDFIGTNTEFKNETSIPLANTNAIYFKPELSNEFPIFYSEYKQKGENKIKFTGSKISQLKAQNIRSLYIPTQQMINLYSNDDFTGNTLSLYGPQLLSFDDQHSEWDGKIASASLVKSVNKTAENILQFINQVGESHVTTSTGDIPNTYNDPVSTLETVNIESGFLLTLFTNQNFEGDHVSIMGPYEIALNDINWYYFNGSYKLHALHNRQIINDKTVQFYSGEPGQGVAAVFPIDGKSVEIPSLKRHYLNKKIASIVSGPDVSIQLFSGKNYNGESTIIEGGKGSQNLGQWVNKASSLKIIPKTNTEYSPQPNCNENAIIRIYEHANFGGKCVSYNQDVPFLEDMNDRMSSYKIKSGYKVQFYEHGNWDGKYFTRSSDNSFSDEFNDSISSIKIIK